MSGAMSRRKGAVGEREAAAALNDVLGQPDRFHRGRQYHGGPGTPDLRDTAGRLHVECKRTETLNLYRAMDQAVGDAGDAVPVVMHRRNGREWIIAARLADLPALAQAITKTQTGDDNGTHC